MSYYKILNSNHFQHNEYELIPIRYEDRFAIMNWRNEQIYHLRQEKPLTIDDQNNYFNNVVNQLFDLKQPNQILFSLLKNGTFIGYGGAVHINWSDKNTELSFIMDTKLEVEFFEEIWTNYLHLIEQVIFHDLKFHKFYTFAYDLRPNLYPILEKNGFLLEARLKEHKIFNDEYVDVIIHSKINKNGH